MGAVSRVITGIAAGLALAFGAQAQETPRSDAFDWSVNLHAVDVDYDIAKARAALQKARELGAKRVRTTFDWYRLEPIPGSWDAHYLGFFNDYLNEARALGLDVTAVLYHAPVWAMELYLRGDVSSFLNSYFRYTQKVASAYGDRLTYYQYWGELNHDLVDPVKREDDWMVLLYGDRGVRSADTNGHRGMVQFATDFYNGPYWVGDLTHTFRRLNLNEPNHTVRVIGINLYPDTWSLGGQQSWSALGELNLALRDPRSPCFAFDGAVMETGFSTFIPAGWASFLGKTEAEQAKWYAASLPAIQQRLLQFNSSGSSRYLFVNLYELFDSRSNFPFNPDANFGLYRMTGEPKDAVNAIRGFIGTSASSQASEPSPEAAPSPVVSSPER